MSGSLNQVELIGNLGRDPEVKRLNNGDRVATLSVATSDSWTDKQSGERREKVEWHRVVIFNDKLAEVAEKYLHKGSKLFVRGEMRTREWEKDGVKRYTTEVVVNNFRGQLILLGDGRGGDSRPRDDSAVNPPAAEPGARKADFDDEIPF